MKHDSVATSDLLRWYSPPPSLLSTQPKVFNRKPTCQKLTNIPVVTMTLACVCAERREAEGSLGQFRSNGLWWILNTERPSRVKSRLFVPADFRVDPRRRRGGNFKRSRTRTQPDPPAPPINPLRRLRRAGKTMTCSDLRSPPPSHLLPPPVGTEIDSE